MEIIKPSRRGFITGLASLVVAPAVVRVESLMPVKVMKPEFQEWLWYNPVTDNIEVWRQALRETGRMIVDLIPEIYDVKPCQ